MAQPLPYAARPRGQLRNPSGPRAPSKRLESSVMVTPLARGLAILAAFSHEQVWMSNKQIALETGLPAPTVSRLLRSLVALGYVRHDEARRKYRLVASVLGLGYAAIAEGALQRLVGAEMRAFAEATNTYVMLSTRDRLDMVVIHSHMGSGSTLSVDMTPGTRYSLGGAVMGSALLAVLSEQESSYLLEALQRNAGPKWPEQRRRTAEKIAQTRTLGFCMSPGEWVPEISSISTPIHIPGHPPWVLSCTGQTARMPRTFMERELGPRLVVMAQSLQQKMAAFLG
ncbi:MAG: IclR family transcriptional regulator [Acidovorax sp.]